MDNNLPIPVGSQQSQANIQDSMAYQREVDPSTDYGYGAHEEYDKPIDFSQYEFDSDLGEFFDGFYNAMLSVVEGVVNAPAMILGSVPGGDDWEDFWGAWADGVGNFFDDSIYAKSNQQIAQSTGHQATIDKYAKDDFAFAVGQGFGQMAEQMLWMLPGLQGVKLAGTMGKLGKAAKLSKYASQAGKVINPISKSGKAVNWIQKNQGIIQIANGAFQQWPMTYKEARNSGLNPNDAIVFSNSVAALIGASEKVGLDYFGKVITSKASKQAQMYAVKKSLKGVTKEMAENGLTRESMKKISSQVAKDWGYKLRKGGAKFAEGFAGEAVQEGSQTYIETIAKDIYNKGFADEYAKKGDGKFDVNVLSEETLKEALFSGLVGGIVGGTSTTLFAGQDNDQLEGAFQYIDAAVKKGKTSSIQKLKNKYSAKRDNGNSMQGAESMHEFIDEVAEFSEATKDLKLSPTERYKHFSYDQSMKSVNAVRDEVNKTYDRAVEKNDGTELYYEPKKQQLDLLSKSVANQSRTQIESAMDDSKPDNESKTSFQRRMSAFRDLARKVEKENLTTKEFMKEMAKVESPEAKSRREEVYSEVASDSQKGEKLINGLRDIALEKDKAEIDRLMDSGTKDRDAYELALQSALLNNQEEAEQKIDEFLKEMEESKEEESKKKEESKDTAEESEDSEGDESPDTSDPKADKDNDQKKISKSGDYDGDIEESKDIDGIPNFKRKGAIKLDDDGNIVVSGYRTDTKNPEAKKFMAKAQRGAGQYIAVDTPWTYGDPDETTTNVVTKLNPGETLMSKELEEELGVKGAELDVDKFNEDNNKYIKELQESGFDGDIYAEAARLAYLEQGIKHQIGSLETNVDGRSGFQRELVNYDPDNNYQAQRKKTIDNKKPIDDSGSIEAEIEKLEKSNPGAMKGVKVDPFKSQGIGSISQKSVPLEVHKSGDKYKYTTSENTVLTKKQKEVADEIFNKRQEFSQELVYNEDGTSNYVVDGENKTRTSNAIGEKIQYAGNGWDAEPGTKTAALSVGTSFDKLIREVIEKGLDPNIIGDYTNVETQEASGIMSDDKVQFDQTTKITSNAVKQVNRLLQFIEENDLVVIADEVMVNRDGVAGALDLVVVDPKGRVGILDMKNFMRKNGGLVEDFLSKTNPYQFENETDIVELSKPQGYMAQQLAYKRMFENTYGIPVSFIGLIPIQTSYSRLADGNGMVDPVVTDANINSIVYISEDSVPQNIVDVVDSIFPPIDMISKSYNQYKALGKKRIVQGLESGTLSERDVYFTALKNDRPKFMMEALQEYKERSKQEIDDGPEAFKDFWDKNLGDQLDLFDPSSFKQRMGIANSESAILMSSDPEFASSLIDHFKEAYPDVPVEFIENVLWMEGPEVLAQITKAGIKINKDTAHQDTLAHEYAHIYTEALRIMDPKLLRKGIEHVKGTEYMKWANENYPELSQAEREMEALTQMIAARSISELISRSKQTGTWLNGVSDWLKQFWNRVKEIFGSNEAATNRMVREMMNNTRDLKLSQVNMNRSTLQMKTRADFTDEGLAHVNDVVQDSLIMRTMQSLAQGKKLTASELYQSTVANLYSLYKKGSPSISNKIFGNEDFYGVQKDTPMTSEEFSAFAQALVWGNTDRKNQIDSMIRNSVYGSIQQDIEYEDINVGSLTDARPNNSFKGPDGVSKEVMKLLMNVTDQYGMPIDSDLLREVMAIASGTTTSQYLKSLDDYVKKNINTVQGYTASRLLRAIKRINQYDKSYGKMVMTNLSSLHIPNKQRIVRRPDGTLRREMLNSSNAITSAYNTAYENFRTLGSEDFQNYLASLKKRGINPNYNKPNAEYLAFLMGMDNVTEEQLDIIRINISSIGFDYFKGGKVTPGFLFKDKKRVSVSVDSSGVTSIDYGVNDVVADAMKKRLYGAINNIAPFIFGGKVRNRYQTVGGKNRSAIQTQNNIIRQINNKRIYTPSNYSYLKNSNREVMLAPMVYAEVEEFSVGGVGVEINEATEIDRIFADLVNTEGDISYVSLGQLGDREHSVQVGVSSNSFSALEDDKTFNTKAVEYSKAMVDNAINVHGVPVGEVASRFNKLVKFAQMKVTENGYEIIPAPVSEYASDKNVIAKAVKADESLGAVIAQTFGNGKKAADAIQRRLRATDLSRFYLQGMMAGNVLLYKDPQAVQKRISGAKTNGNKMDIKKPVHTVVVDFGKFGEDNEIVDSFKIINQSLFNSMEDSVGKGNIGPNIKDNINQVNSDGSSLYVKAASLSAEGLLSLTRRVGTDKVDGSDVATKLIVKLREYTEAIAKAKGLSVGDTNVQFVDVNSLKGTDSMANNVVKIEDLLSSDFSMDNVNSRTITGMTMPFDINKDLSNKPNKSKVVSIPVQSVEIAQAYTGEKVLSELMAEQVENQMESIKALFDNPKTLFDTLTNSPLDFMTSDQKAILRLIKDNMTEAEAKELREITSFDHPAVASFIKGMLSNKISANGLRLNVQGMNNQIVPDYNQELSFGEDTGIAEVIVPWSLFFERIPGKTDNEMIAFANEQLRLNPFAFDMVAARVPVSGPVSGFVGRPKRFTSGSMNTVTAPKEYAVYSDSDHDGDKLFLMVSDRNARGVEEETTNTRIINEMKKAMTSDDYIRDRKKSLDFDWMNDLVKELKLDKTPKGVLSSVEQARKSVQNNVTGSGISLSASVSKLIYFMDSHGMSFANPIDFGGKQYQEIDSKGDSMDLVNQILQAFLDANNNDAILRLGVNSNNLPTVLTLAAIGVDRKEIFQVINSEAVKDFEKTITGNSSTFSLEDTKKSKDVAEYLRGKMVGAYSTMDNNVVMNKDRKMIFDYGKGTKEGLLSSIDKVNSYRGAVPVMVDGDYYIANKPQTGIAWNLTPISYNEYVEAISNDDNAKDNLALTEYASVQHTGAEMMTLLGLLGAKKSVGTNVTKAKSLLGYMDRLRQGSSKLNMGTALTDPHLKSSVEVLNYQTEKLRESFATENPKVHNLSTEVKNIGVSNEESWEAVSKALERAQFMTSFFNNESIPKDFRDSIYSLYRGKSSDLNAVSNNLRDILYALKYPSNPSDINQVPAYVNDVISAIDVKEYNGNVVIGLSDAFQQMNTNQQESIRDSFQRLIGDPKYGNIYKNVVAHSFLTNPMQRTKKSLASLIGVGVTENYLMDMSDLKDQMNDGTDNIFGDGYEGNHNSPNYTVVPGEFKQSSFDNNMVMRINSALMLSNKIPRSKTILGRPVVEPIVTEEFGDYKAYQTTEFGRNLNNGFAFIDNATNDLYVQPYSNEEVNTVYIKVGNINQFKEGTLTKLLTFDRSTTTDSDVSERMKTCG